MSDPETYDLNDVPKWALKDFDATPAPRSERSVLDYRGHAAWPLLVGAATVSTFLPGDLAPASSAAPERPDAESTVLRFAEPSFDGEERKWSLTSDARKAVLSAIDVSDITALGTDKRDPLTDALRDILRGERKAGYETTDMRALEATRLAATWLGDAKPPEAPSVEELDRQIELRRLLAPFEHMVGRLPAVGTEPPKDRFFGRTKEIKQLRNYVGVLPPDSLLNRAARAASSFVHLFTPHDPMCIWGTGGVGKTTLVARFMLEHAEVARSRFPFAYLDFDRATLSSRNVLGLLGEMCQQVGAQFPELTAPMGGLRRQLTELTHKFEKNPEEAISILGQFAQQFRQHIEEYLDASESRFEFARPFLLVLDTFEVVQYSPDQVSGLEYFIRAFSLPNEPGLWPRLRLIISGRSKVTEFIVKIAESDVLELGALERDGSAEMLVAFAADAGKPIPKKDALRLVDAIAKAVGDKPKSGVRPLRLRLIGTVFDDEKKSSDSGAELVDKLIAEVTQPDTAMGVARHLFVDGILVRRILRHVKDSRVRALADPGLVVRRITPEIIRNVMTRGTADPAKVPDDVSDAPPSEPWIVTKEEAGDIFEAFRHEVSLVEPDDRDTNALRHRQDVRRDMLPLIKARRRQRFFALHRLAYDYFSKAASSNPNDAASAREALYHGLWLDQDFGELDRFWRPDARIDPAEFEAGSRASVYIRLKSRKGPATLSAEEIAALPPDVALDWLASHSDDLLRYRRLDETIATVRAVTGPNFERIGPRHDLGAVVARLLYRGGLWHDVALLLRDQVDMNKLDSPAQESLLRTWATIAGRSSAPFNEIDEIAPRATTLRDPLSRIEVLAQLVIGLRSAGRDSWRYAQLREALDHIVGTISQSQWMREPRILRLAVLASSDPNLARAYVMTTERLPRDPEVTRHLQALNSRIIFPSGASRQAGDAIDNLWRKERSAILELDSSAEFVAHIRAIVAYDHADWSQALGNALSRALASAREPVQKAFENFRKSSDAQRAFQRDDGPSLVQIATDEGQLMDVVRRLADAPAPQAAPARDLVAVSARELTFRYPDTASGIAIALLAWHASALAASEPTVEQA